MDDRVVMASIIIGTVSQRMGRRIMAKMGRRLQLGLVASVTGLALCAALVACGPGGEEAKAPAVETVEQALARETAEAETWEWPQGPRPTAQLHVAGMGTIEIELYPELAPKTVANFLTLSEKSFYDGTTFHRVIPGFMVQGGDPLTREDKDPDNDGMGGPGYEIDDEFTEAPHLRGVVSMSNDGRPRTGGSQFFIVQQDALHLNGLHTVFGRVVSGMDVVDRITEVERDEVGRWGPPDRPIENVVVSRVEVSRAGPGGAGAAMAGDGANSAQPASEAPHDGGDARAADQKDAAAAADAEEHPAPSFAATSSLGPGGAGGMGCTVDSRLCPLGGYDRAPVAR